VTVAIFQILLEVVVYQKIASTLLVVNGVHNLLVDVLKILVVARQLLHLYLKVISLVKKQMPMWFIMFSLMEPLAVLVPPVILRMV